MPIRDTTGRKDALQAFRIAGLPHDFYYIPNFISAAEELSILQKIPSQRWTQLTHRRLQAHPSTLTKNNTLLASPLPDYLTNPVVQRFKELGIFNETPHQQPNHVLINEYKPGEGIMPHEDGAAYAPVVATVSLGTAICLEITRKTSSTVNMDRNEPTTAESVGEKSAQDEPMPTQDNLPTRIFQEARSLLLTTGDAYRDLFHGIEHIEVDEQLTPESVANWNLLGQSNVIQEAGGRNIRETRISLTYRDVLKVSSAASKVFGGLQKR